MDDISLDNYDVKNFSNLDMNSALERAYSFGECNELDQLLSNNIPQQKIGNPLIFKIIDKLKENGDSESYLKFQFCLKQLLKDRRIDVNCTDEQGNTPLHYTVEYKWDEITKLLLECGAYIGVKNSHGKLPIDGINAKLLREFFDSKITTTYNNHTSIDNNFEIDLDYSFLIKKPGGHKKTQLSQNTNQFYPIEFISQSEDLKDLILHPLIRYLIWTKSEILTYLFVWNGFTFLASLLTIIHITFFNTSQTKLSQPEGHILTLIPTWICISVYILMLFYKILDFYNSNKSVRVYGVWQFIVGLGYLFIALLLVTILFIDYDDLRKTLTAVCILLIAIDMNVIIATMPKFQKMSVHFLMLKKITFKFIKVLLFYFIILFAFSLSFYVLDAKTTTADSNVFKLLGQFFMRVIGMMIGELNLEFDNNLVFYYIFMLLFVFMITIVLINLLNGLAISDVGEIRVQAKLIHLVYRVQLIASCNNFVTNYVWLRKYIFRFRRRSGVLVDVALCRYVKEIKIQPNKNLSTIKHILRPIDPEDVDEIEWPKINDNILNQMVTQFQHELEAKVSADREEELKNKVKEINEKLDRLMSRLEAKFD